MDLGGSLESGCADVPQRPETVFLLVLYRFFTGFAAVARMGIIYDTFSVSRMPR